MFDIILMQIDYLMFLEGLAHLVLAVICLFILDKDKEQRLPWLWLGCFSIMQGLKEWLALLHLTVSNILVYEEIQLLLAMTALLFLLEFGREGYARLHGKGPGRWLYFPLLLLVLAGGVGLNSLVFSFELVFTLVGGLWSAWNILYLYKIKEHKSFSLAVLGLAIGVPAGLVLSAGSGLVSESSTNIQIHLLRILISLGTLAAAWFFAGTSVKPANPAEGGPGPGKRAGSMILAACLGTLLCGWVFVDALGRLADKELRQNMISMGVTAATAIDPDRLTGLNGRESDAANPDFEYLRRQLITIHRTNPQCRFVYLMGLKEGKVIFLADAEPEDSENYSPPGQTYDEASESLINSFSDGKPFIEGPVADRWGRWISVIVPILNDQGDGVAAVFGMDISAGDWPWKFSLYRLAGIAVTLIVFLTVLFFTAMRLNKEEALKSASSEKNFRAIFENATEGIFVFEVTSRRIIDVNPHVCRWLGYERSELLDRNIEEIFGTWLQEIQADLYSERGWYFDQARDGKCLSKDGALFDVAMTGTTLRYRGKDCIIVFARDVRMRKRAEEKMRTAHQQLLDIIEFLPDATFVVDQEKKVIAWNRAMEEITGIPKEDIIGKDSDGWVRPFYGWSRAVLIDLIFSNGLDIAAKYDYINQKGDTYFAEIYLPSSPERKEAYLWITASPLYDSSGGLAGAIETIRDITERKQIEQQLHYLATHDSLTGIPNRYLLEESLRTTVSRARRGKKSALLFLDLDNFKLINDTFGHAAGDELLISFVNILKGHLREGDVLARLGGDEFAVLLEGTSEEDARAVAERLRCAVDSNELCLVKYKAFVNVSVSIGIVMVDGTLDSQKLLTYADIALYASKEDGRNRVSFVQPNETLISKHSETNSMITLIKNAIRYNNFVVFFQPVCRLADGSVLHYEALTRLRHENKLIAPGGFIAVAERFGLMPQIDRWVIQRSLILLQKNPSLNLFINLSGVSLGDETLLQFIEDEIQQSGIEPTRLGFEITETAAVKDLGRAERWIYRLKGLGCKFALDDFGMGFSSFSYLRLLPVDYLKIDGSFVRNLHKEPAHRALIQAMNNVAHALGKNTIAEFVESEAILRILQEIEVDCGQGYYLGKPVPLSYLSDDTRAMGF